MLRPLQKAFLTAYRTCGNVTRAAELSKVGRRSHYDWRDEEEYAEAFADATEEAGDRMVSEARRRAVEGVSRPVFYKGDICGLIQEYSDNLLMFLIKQARPEYRENYRVEHTGAEGAPITVNVRFVETK